MPAEVVSTKAVILESLKAGTKRRKKLPSGVT